MKKLINTIKKIENILTSTEVILNREYNNLLNSKTSNSDMLESIEKKTILFKKFFTLSQDRLALEKKYDIFAPYKNHNELHDYWNNIIKKCLLLRELNMKNKILLNKKFYLNQNFLELFPTYKTAVTYNCKGYLKI